MELGLLNPVYFRENNSRAKCGDAAHLAQVGECLVRIVRCKQPHLLHSMIVGALCLVQVGCVYRDEEGQGASYSWTPEPQTVIVNDYKISDAVSGTLYASGCQVQDISYTNCPGCDIKAYAPYGRDYLLELTSFRHLTSNTPLSDMSAFCDIAYESQQISHRNPTCYQPDSSYGNATFLSASLVDATGAALSSTDEWITGTSTDIERFVIRSSAQGVVLVSLAGAPCNHPSDIETLLTVLTP